MTHRPVTARSEISSAISDDGFYPPPPLPPGALDRATPTPTTPAGIPTTPSAHGFAHLRGVTSPTNRTLRSPAPSSLATSSRPHTPDSVVSKTHVPSLTAQGFLRPMNSSRLQQQRLQNLRTQRAGREQYTSSLRTESAQENDDAQSVHSNRTGPYAPLPRFRRPAPSFTTGYTESEAPDDSEVRLNHASDQADEYHRPPQLPQTGRPAPPVPLNLQNTRLDVSHERAIKSPRSFRSGLSIGSKQIFEPGHQHLPSTDLSPQYTDMLEKQREVEKKASGKNYEYFEGRNVFWMGGRLQNARDKPINILTGLLIVLPTILFFVYS